jgi:uncharacterized protein YdiU (UPF0061 family)
MMGAYNPGTVYSSIDTQGRYAFGNQPSITLWNITRLAECLLPLINADDKVAIARVEPLLKTFAERFQNSYYKMLGNKLGITDATSNDRALIDALLQAMQAQELDYTQTFIDLTRSLDDETTTHHSKDVLASWYSQWRERLQEPTTSLATSVDLMKASNPVVIPRNHHVENVLKICEETGSSKAADDFLQVLRSPYNELAETANYQDLPQDNDAAYRTFCGT